jgi:hypothetical protein
MPTRFKWALLITFLCVCIIAGFRLFIDNRSDAHSKATSDASTITDSIVIGVDSWIGYYPLCSKHFRSSMRNKGVRATCSNEPDLDKRFEQLKEGTLQFATTSVDAYLALGGAHQFPGSIIAVIDESKGGDALVAWEESVTSIDDLKSNPEIRVSLATDTPSEQLIRSLGVHFDVPLFRSRGEWLVSAESAAEAANKLLSNQGF